MGSGVSSSDARAQSFTVGDGTADVGFRVFVEVPAPATLVLVAVGFLLAGGCKGRRGGA